jgi:hypothetical protein
MQFKVTKVVIARTGGTKGFANLLFIPLIILIVLLVLAACLVIIPVVLIGSLFKKKSAKEIPANQQPQSTLLTGNGKVSIYTVPDENDQELNLISDIWAEAVEDEMVPVYIAHTNPHIQDLHGKFITDFVKEAGAGVFLQLVEMKDHTAGKISTKLVFLSYADQTVADVLDVGPYFLFNDKTSEWLVKGFNKNDDIELSLSYRND